MKLIRSYAPRPSLIDIDWRIASIFRKIAGILASGDEIFKAFPVFRYEVSYDFYYRNKRTCPIFLRIHIKDSKLLKEKRRGGGKKERKKEKAGEEYRDTIKRRREVCGNDANDTTSCWSCFQAKRALKIPRRWLSMSRTRSRVAFALVGRRGAAYLLHLDWISLRWGPRWGRKWRDRFERVGGGGGGGGKGWDRWPPGGGGGCCGLWTDSVVGGFERYA